MTTLLTSTSDQINALIFRDELLNLDTDTCVVAEAVKAFPSNSGRTDDKHFANKEEFNLLMGRVFRSLRESPLTHGQFLYLLNKAHVNLAKSIIVGKVLDFDLILNDPYALAVHQIVVAYGTTFGTGYALTQMNSNNDALHKNSEGALKANEVILRILHPPKTNRGYAESLTAFIIREHASPALITHAIKLRINHHLSKDFKKYEYKYINPLSLFPLYEEEANTADGVGTSNAGSALNAYRQIRFDELRETFNYALQELMAKGQAQEEQEASQKPVSQYLDMYAAQALRAFFDKENREYIVNKPFNVQLFHLWPVLGFSRHKCGLIANHIVGHFRTHLEMEFTSEFAQRTVIKSPTSRKRREEKPVCLTTRTPELETKTVLVDVFKSPHVTKSDQDLLQLCMSEGLHIF